VITVAELSDWINTLEPEEMIGIDEGGLSLVVLDSRAYHEIGGMPKENNERSNLANVAVQSTLALAQRGATSAWIEPNL
jgi:hypothetical protein